MTRTGTTNTNAKWERKRLGTLLRLSTERIEPSEHVATLFNYVGLEHIESHTGRILPHDHTPGSEIKSTKNVFRPGQILYGKLRPYLNKVHLAGAKGICSTDIFVLEPKGSALLAAFAAYYLRSAFVLCRVESLMEGTSLPRMNQKDLLGFPIHVPPRAEQERIVRVLDEAESLRTLRRQADHRAAALMPAIFHDMFGDHTTNPKGWPIADFGDLIVNQDFRRIPVRAADRTTRLGPYPYYGASGIIDYINDFIFDEKSLLIAEDGANLFARTNPIAFIATGKYWVNNHAHVVAENGKADLDYLCMAINLRDVSDYVTGSAQPKLNQKNLNRIPFCVPPLPLQRAFATRVVEVRKLEAKQAASRRRVHELFQSLLHRALRGELTQPAASVVVPDQAFQEDPLYRRAAIAAYVVKRLHRRKTFGRVQLAKTPYLTETHVGVALAGRYNRAAAGPLDLKALDEVETLAAERRWFSKHQRAGEKKGYLYKPGPSITEAVKTAEAILGDRRAEMDHLLNLMAGWNTDQAEMVATLFAAWNDFLLDGIKPIDQQIISEVRDNWHVNKQKLTPYRLKKMLNLMRREHLIPRGIGPKTMPSKEKSLWQSSVPRT